MNEHVQDFETAVPMQLIYIPAEHIAGLWDQILPFVPTIIERSGGRISLDTLADSLLRGDRQMWIVWDGANVKAVVGTDIGTLPTGLKVCTIQFATGDNSNAWIHLIHEIEDWAVKNGCTKLDMWARKGWQRKLPDYKMTHVMLEKDIG